MSRAGGGGAGQAAGAGGAYSRLSTTADEDNGDGGDGEEGRPPPTPLRMQVTAYAADHCLFFASGTGLCIGAVHWCCALGLCIGAVHGGAHRLTVAAADMACLMGRA